MLLCYITDRRQFAGDEAARRRALLAKVGDAARAGVDYVQLREKDLPIRELECLARDAAQALRENAKPAAQNVKLLVNTRIDVALAAGADGVHLPSGELSASDTRAVWDLASRNMERSTGKAVIGVSCHTREDVLAAEAHGADFAVFAPVFEKTARAGVGLEQLRATCQRSAAGMPVLALGGVTLVNAQACVDAGAAGIAAIRLFQENDIDAVVAQLRIARH